MLKDLSDFEKFMSICISAKVTEITAFGCTIKFNPTESQAFVPEVAEPEAPEELKGDDLIFYSVTNGDASENIEVQGAD